MAVRAEQEGLTPLLLGGEGVEVTLLDLTRLDDLESAAARVLAAQERREYAQLKHPLRRLEWLGARVCLKTMLHRRGSVSDPRQCAIVKDARGRPSLSGAHTVGAYDCSLSHAGRFVVAGLARGHGRIGVDVEPISARLLKMAGLFEHHHLLVGSQAPEVRLAILWALREAYAKVVGQGIAAVFDDVRTQETAEGRHRLFTPDGRRFRARHVLHNGYVIALCVEGADHGESAHLRREGGGL